jgi:rRNA-processing protein FCF1
MAQSIHGHYSRGILVDTNLLLLLVIGSCDRAQIGRFKRTSSLFTDADYDLLLAGIQGFKAIITTPHILTEVSNMMGQLEGKLKQQFFRRFALQILTGPVTEIHVSCKDIVQNQAFLKFGLTDIGIEHVAREHYLVLTMDFPLANYLATRGIQVVNFNHIRQMGWDRGLTTG